jgi:hypothetical protein
VVGIVALDLGLSNGSQEYREWIWPATLLFLFAVVASGWVVVDRRSGI